MSASTKDLQMLADWLLLQSVNQSNNAYERRKFAKSGDWLHYWLDSKKLVKEPNLQDFVVDCVRDEMELFEHRI